LKVIKKLEEEKVIVSNYDSYIPKFVNNGREYKFLKNSTGEILNSYFRKRERIIYFLTASSITPARWHGLGLLRSIFLLTI